MQWDNPSSEDSSAQEDEYLNPRYYQQPESANPLPRYTDPYGNYKLDSLSSDYYRNNSEYVPSDQMEAYRGPEELEGYTPDAGETQRDAAESGSSNGSGKRKGLAGTGVIGIGALLLKFGPLFLKFGIAGISAAVSVFFYASIFGWTFAVGLMALLFIHESGHAIVMKIKGIPIKGMIFIPMFGAAVVMNSMPRNARDEAEVGIAGPIAGTIAATFCFVVAQSSTSPGIWASLAYFGFFLNLFNLIPVIPFDGGRVVSAIDRRVWIIGFVALLGLLVWTFLHGTLSIWLLLLTFMAATQLFSRSGKDEAAQGYYNVPLRIRIIMGVLYFGLIAGLALGMMLAQTMMRIG